MAQNMIFDEKIFDAEEIAASGVTYSRAIDLAAKRPEGYLRLYLALTGSGTCRLEWRVSVDGKNYIVPTGYSNEICSDFTKDSGSHSIEAGDSGFIVGVAGMVEINEQIATVASITATTVTTDIDASGFTPYTSGGTFIPTIPTGKDRDADAVITGITAADPAVVTVDRGRDLFVIYAPPMPFLKIMASETAGVSTVTITAWTIIV